MALQHAIENQILLELALISFCLEKSILEVFEVEVVYNKVFNLHLELDVTRGGGASKNAN